MSVLVKDRSPGKFDITMELRELEKKTFTYLNQNKKLAGRYFTILGQLSYEAFETARLVDPNNVDVKLINRVDEALDNYLSQANLLFEVNMSLVKNSEKRYGDFLSLLEFVCSIKKSIHSFVDKTSTEK